MRHVQYIRRPRPDADYRHRVSFDLERGRILGFVVQLEYLVNEAWQPVVRYDTAHGFAHRDRYLPDGTVLAHEPMVVADYNEALTFAADDVRANADQWLRPFREYYRHESV